MTKKILIAVGFSGLTGTILFVLVRIVLNTPELNYDYFQTAIVIQFFHTLVLLSFAFKNQYIRESRTKIVYYFFLFGIVLSCIPLYLIHFTGATGVIKEIYSTITIFSSGLLLGGWVTIIYMGLMYRSKNKKH
ncbi:MAG: DUF423 domain-containing protein [Bacteroidales bacterium]|nr:DUF423 domain-containing protein [Bacteroidales bacterium]